MNGMKELLFNLIMPYEFYINRKSSMMTEAGAVVLFTISFA